MSNSNIAARKNTLLNKIESAKVECKKLGDRHYRAHQIILWSSVIASAAAAVLAFVDALNASKSIVGLVAALPAILTVVGKQINFAGKAYWHFEYVDGLDALERELTVKEIADADLPRINDQYSELTRKMTWRGKSVFGAHPETQKFQH